MWLKCIGVVSGWCYKERYIFLHILLIPTPLVLALFSSRIPTFCSLLKYIFSFLFIVESVGSISRGELDSPQTQYITNGRISRARYIITHFKHHHRVL